MTDSHFSVRGLAAHSFLTIVSCAILCSVQSVGAALADPTVEVFATGTPAISLIAPDGGGRPLSDIGVAITVRVLDDSGAPIAGLAAQDLWLESVVAGEVALCHHGSEADAGTDADGYTTFNGPFSGGGWTDQGLRVNIYGIPMPPVIDLGIVSPDITGDRVVDLADVGAFSSVFGGAYSPDCDLWPDGAIDLVDVGLMAEFFGATCP